MHTPAWLVSLVLHALLVVALGYVANFDPHGTNAAPRALLLASFGVERTNSDYFEDEAQVQVDAASPPAASDASQSDDAGPGERLADIFAREPPVDATAALPSGLELAGLVANETGRSTGAGSFTAGPRRPVRLEGGRTRTSVYGIEAEGSKFVYVFDRSASMGGPATSPLNAAKAELAASLENLGDIHQFQIIFYNHRPTLMPLARQAGGLVFGNDEHKALAQRFIGGIRADGATEHYDALVMALNLAPDVIFFLTDADEPELSAAQMARIKRQNGGRTSINTIEFGIGRAGRRDNFLVRLARENDGQHVYIDISNPDALH